MTDALAGNRKIWLFACLLCFSGGLEAKYYSSGQDPASIYWHQTNTPNFKVIYPMGYERTANYVTNVLEYARSIDSISLSTNLERIPVILHNRTVVSNAATSWAPRRMDFHNIPQHDTHGQEWFQQLALHEYRYLIQMSKLNQGLTKVLTYIFGEQASAAVFGLYVPFWFIGGDAAVPETALSKTGQGRVPSISMPLRAQVLEKGNTNTIKQYLDHTKLIFQIIIFVGYNLVAQARKDYGIKIWDHTL